MLTVWQMIDSAHVNSLLCYFLGVDQSVGLFYDVLSVSLFDWQCSAMMCCINQCFINQCLVQYVTAQFSMMSVSAAGDDDINDRRLWCVQVVRSWSWSAELFSWSVITSTSSSGSSLSIFFLNIQVSCRATSCPWVHLRCCDKCRVVMLVQNFCETDHVMVSNFYVAGDLVIFTSFMRKCAHLQWIYPTLFSHPLLM